MASIDPSISEPTPTSRMADRADVWRVANVLLRGAGLIPEYDAEDVLYLAQYLAGEDF